MSFLSQLRRAWVTIQVPGTTSERIPATYVEYPSDGLPPVPADIASLDWLRQATRHPEDYLARAAEAASGDLSAKTVADLLGAGTSLPDDFTQFLADGLRDRLRSATDSYFDLGDSTVAVDGGRLLHLISDSQWTYHWLLYLGDDGSSAVVGSGFPAGFSLEPEEAAGYREEDREYVVVADSFSEFVWRWWMDNDVFYRTEVEHIALTPSQQTYVTRYGHPAKLS
ncbi:hypothetical protein [Kribbella sp. NPDC048928]|uniref:hypothetical protein n=1 Tax=Kribbella sp. NPDC048928 TaxID=3364111 RepID=UPI003724912C